MSSSYLGVVGIRPDPRSVGPRGHHIRWSFPAERGFPPAGFRVYRRQSAGIKLDCRAFADAATGRGATRVDTWSDDGIALHPPPGLTLTAVPGQPWLDCGAAAGGGPALLRVDLDPPVVALEIRFGPPGSPTPTLRAFDGGRLVAESRDATVADADGVRAIRVSGPVMTSATVSVTFAELHAICRLTLEAACAGAWGAPRHLPLLAPPPSTAAATQLVRTVLGPDTMNRYVASLDAAAARYAPEVIGLLEWLRALLDPEGHDSSGRQRMRDPDPEHFLPAVRLVVSRDGKSPLQGIRAQAVLLLAALDPNIARLLCLAWVDRDIDLDDKGDVYDYKVEGLWPPDGRLCGVALEVGRAFAERPSLSTHPHGESVVLRGVRWRGREPRRRVGVRWPEPPGPGPQGAPTRAVLFDVIRDGGSGGPPGPGGGAHGTGRDPRVRKPSTRCWSPGRRGPRPGRRASSMTTCRSATTPTGCAPSICSGRSAPRAPRSVSRSRTTRRRPRPCVSPPVSISRGIPGAPPPSVSWPVPAPRSTWASSTARSRTGRHRTWRSS